MRLLARLLRALNSETDPAQISLAVCLALIAGLTPLFSAHNLLVLLAALLLRVNLSAFIAATLALSGLAYLLDPLFHLLGRAILTAQPLLGAWTALYGTTWFRLAHLNNTVIMGSLVTALILFVPTFMLGNALVRRYRSHVLAWAGRLRVVQMLKASRLYRAYRAAADIGGV